MLILVIPMELVSVKQILQVTGVPHVLLVSTDSQLVQVSDQFDLSLIKDTGCPRSSWTKLNSFFRQETINGVRNVICACSLGLDICVFTFRIDFELGG